MTPAKVAEHFNAHQVSDGQWRGKCPAHNGKSHTSLSVRSTSDGKVLLRCWGGCRTDEVLQSAGLSWTDLFPDSHPSSSQPRQVDPEIALQRKAEKALRAWKSKQGSVMSARLWVRHRLITEGERLIAAGGSERGWDLLQLGYLGLSRLTWLADLIDSKHREDWEKAREFLGAQL